MDFILKRPANRQQSVFHDLRRILPGRFLRLAGSIGSDERVAIVKEMNPWTFTMGSALFSKNFVKDGTFRENLEYVIGLL